MVKSYVVGGWVGGPGDYTVSYLGQVIVIVIGRPRSLTTTKNYQKLRKSTKKDQKVPVPVVGQ